jgi:hypothetical protein
MYSIRHSLAQVGIRSRPGPEARRMTTLARQGLACDVGCCLKSFGAFEAAQPPAAAVAAFELHLRYHKGF